MSLVAIVLTRFMALKYQACDDLDEALDSLQQHDPSLPDLKSYRAELSLEGRQQV